MKIYYLLALIVFINSAQFSQWVQTSGPAGGKVSAIAASGTDLYAATGNGGFGYGSGLYKSTNNGQLWKSVEYAVLKREDKNLSSVAVSGNVIAIGSQNRLVLISRDGGANWERTSVGTKDITALVTDGTTLFAGTNGDGVFTTPLTSTAWTAANTGLADKKVSSLQFAGTTLYATIVGSGKIYSTANGGTSWSAIQMPSTVFNTYSSILVNGKLYVGAQNGVHTSTDNGTTWSGPVAGMPYSPLAFAVSGTTLFAGNGDGLYSVPVSGGSFTKSPATFGVLSLFANASGIWAGTQSTFTSGAMGVMLSTNNGGSWSQMSSGLAGSTIQAVFEHGNKIFAVNNPKGIYVSTDKGTTWSLSNANAYSYDALVQLSAEKNGKLFVSAENGIITSTDAGGTWTTVTTGFTPQALFSYGTRLFAGESGGVRVSTNSGTTWTAANTGLTGYLSTNCFGANNGKLFAGLYSGGVYTSTDSGATWTSSSTGLGSTRIRAFAFLNSIAFAGTDGGGVYKSTDNGLTWSASNTGLSSQNVWSLAVSGAKLFVGSNDGVHVSYDFGATWEKTSPWPMITNALCVTATDVYAGTYCAGVWRKPLSQFVSDASENALNTPGSFTLEQNYPNPFNPSTVIHYTVHANTRVTLKVTDILGNEIATLVSEEKQPGSYSAEFSAARYGLGSGVYFSTLASSGITQTKKMLLTK